MCVVLDEFTNKVSFFFNHNKIISMTGGVRLLLTKTRGVHFSTWASRGDGTSLENSRHPSRLRPCEVCLTTPWGARRTKRAAGTGLVLVGWRAASSSPADPRLRWPEIAPGAPAPWRLPRRLGREGRERSLTRPAASFSSITVSQKEATASHSSPSFSPRSMVSTSAGRERSPPTSSVCFPEGTVVFRPCMTYRQCVFHRVLRVVVAVVTTGRLLPPNHKQEPTKTAASGKQIFFFRIYTLTFCDSICYKLYSHNYLFDCNLILHNFIFLDLWFLNSLSAFYYYVPTWEKILWYLKWDYKTDLLWAFYNIVLWFNITIDLWF